MRGGGEGGREVLTEVGGEGNDACLKEEQRVDGGWEEEGEREGESGLEKCWEFNSKMYRKGKGGHFVSRDGRVGELAAWGM